MRTIHSASLQRDATTIIDALASTVDHDPTAKPYEFIDDTRLAPRSTIEMQQYSLSREAGRRVARCIVTIRTHQKNLSYRQLATDWPTLFMYDRDNPRLDVFRPIPMASLGSSVLLCTVAKV